MSEASPFSIGEVVETAADISAPIFQQQGWKWTSLDGVPDEHDIYAWLFDMVGRMLANPKLLSVRSGRFGVIREDDTLLVVLELGTIEL